MLAVQNMEACGIFDRSRSKLRGSDGDGDGNSLEDEEDQDRGLEFSALQGSLSMMSKVLNDVLDLFTGLG